MTLTGEILHVFERACAEGDMEIAEKLLQALELIDARGSAATTPQEPLAQAYLTIGAIPARWKKCQRHH